MVRKTLALLAVPAVVLAIAVSGVAFVPGILNAMGPGPAATSIGAPAWKVGDSWTYNVSVTPRLGSEILPQAMVLAGSTYATVPMDGTLTMTVSGSVNTDQGDAWNTTLSGSLGMNPLRPIPMTDPAVQTASRHSVSTTGFAWYRQSDLAPIYSLKTVAVSMTWNLTMGNWSMYHPMMNGTYTLTYTATTGVSYHPALTVWRFPLEENATWDVRSNATIHYASTFSILGPNLTYETNRSVSFTVPLAFSMHTGLMESVTTPAGTFDALPVWASRGPSFLQVPDPDASAMMNLTADSDFAMPHGFATAWFSAQAGNVVRVDANPPGCDGPSIRLDLVSYTYG